MPLRDHFRPAARGRRPWDALHGMWPAKIVEALNPHLPATYAAAPQVHLGSGVEIDVATVEISNGHDSQPDASSSENGGGAVMTVIEPTVRVETDLPDMDEYEVRIYDLERQERLVATIEIVSPSNKDRPESRRSFIAECATLLQQKVSVAIVDVVTARSFNLYAELLGFLNVSDPTVSNPPTPIYVAACRGTMPRKRWQFEGWHRPLTIGERLPTIPVWLSDEVHIPLDLELSYEEACRSLRIR